MIKKLKLTLFASLIALSASSQNQTNDQVVMTIDGSPVYLSEFVYIYTKNNPCVSYAKEDLDAYMQLFINYKLKVKEAEHLGYDTIPKLINELAQYRNQLSLPYMIDKEKNEELIKEAYQRTANEVRASHIMIRLKPDASPKDTLEAFNRAMTIRNRLLGGEDFADVARNNSEDPSAITNGGDLGYFHALIMVYPFENAAYNLNVGELSMPVRTNFGYHVIKLTDKRTSKGKMIASHIMIMTNDKMQQAELDKAEQKINEIYTMLESGSTFEELAGKYSEDQSSKGKGGKLPEFGAGTKQRWVPEFEEAAYSIPKDGLYSKPFKSSYGWHIVKRISLTPVGTYEEMYRELKLKVERDMRAETTKSTFINGLKKTYNFKDESAEHMSLFYAIGNEIFKGEWKGFTTDDKDQLVLCTFANVELTVAGFESYLISKQSPQRGENMEEYIRSQYDAFIRAELLKYEDSQLETKYPEFKSLMQEYRDGILVFDVMQNEIWNKASNDSSGIKAYYEAHKSDFTYPVRYQGDLYRCMNKETADRVVAYLKSDTMDYAKIQSAINTTSELTLILKRNTFNSETTDWMKIVKPGKAGDAGQADPCKPGKQAKPAKIRTFKAGINKVFVYNDEYYVFDVKEVMQPRVREFSEAKGLVTAAYQTELEKQWLDELRKKYAVVINDSVLYSLSADN